MILSQENDYKDTLNDGTHSPNKFEETNKIFLLNDKDKDFKRSFIDSIKPSWNGKKSSWNDFWIEWTFYWNNLKLLVGDEDKFKCFAFSQCLPAKEKHHAKRLIIYEEMNFDAISKEYISENTLVLPRYIDEKRWRSFWPLDKKLHTIKRWWFDWNRLSKKVSNLNN